MVGNTHEWNVCFIFTLRSNSKKGIKINECSIRNVILTFAGKNLDVFKDFRNIAIVKVPKNKTTDIRAASGV